MSSQLVGRYIPLCPVQGLYLAAQLCKLRLGLGESALEAGICLGVELKEHVILLAAWHLPAPPSTKLAAPVPELLPGFLLALFLFFYQLVVDFDPLRQFPHGLGQPLKHTGALVVFGKDKALLPQPVPSVLPRQADVSKKSRTFPTMVL